MNPDEFLAVALTPADDRFAARLFTVLEGNLAAQEAGYSDEGETQPLHASLAPRIYGIGGPELQTLGLREICRLPSDKSIEPGVVVEQICDEAYLRQPDAIICFGRSSAFQRIATEIRAYASRKHSFFFNWNPALIHLAENADSLSNTRRSARDSFDVELIQDAPDQQAFLEMAAREITRIVSERKAHLTLL